MGTLNNVSSRYVFSYVMCSLISTAHALFMEDKIRKLYLNSVFVNNKHKLSGAFYRIWNVTLTDLRDCAMFVTDLQLLNWDTVKGRQTTSTRSGHGNAKVDNSRFNLKTVLLVYSYPSIG